MDRMVEEKVAPWIAGIFTLTAHLNHSCDEPNAMVVSQEFVDAHIDLVATRDIQKGEEILISYIQGVQQKSTNQRRRELEAKYLFTCGCNKCTSS
jgi:SET domain-containing protein